MTTQMTRLALKTTRWRGRQHGVHTIELALTISLFMLIFFSSIIGIFLIYSYGATTYLARDGVQYAIRRGDDSAKATDPVRDDALATHSAIENYLFSKGFLGPKSALTIDVCWPGSIDAPCTSSNPALAPGTNNKPGMPVRVTVTYDFHPPILDSIWPEMIQISSSSQGIILF